MGPRFDLLHEPWIPVRDSDGQVREVGLQEALLQAENFLRIESDSPLQTASLHRLLLAVLYRALEGPSSPQELTRWASKGWDKSKIQIYLDAHKEAFDLFHPTRPFYQLPDFPFDGYGQHWTKLSAEDGSGNTSFLFNDAKRSIFSKQQVEETVISPAHAANLLLVHQTFVLEGLIHKFIKSAPRAPSATAAIVILQGRNLQETLLMNLVPQSHDPEDRPIWEQEPYTIEQLKKDPMLTPRGYAQLYTWFSRSIRFYPEPDGNVRFFAYASGVRYQFNPDLRDPMLVYRPSKKMGLWPMGLDQDQAFWRDFTAILPAGKDANDEPPAVINSALAVKKALKDMSPPQALVCGQVTDQAKIIFWRMENYPLPPALLVEEGGKVRADVQRALGESQKTFEILEDSAQKLAHKLVAFGNREVKQKDLKNLVKGFPLSGYFWSSLEHQFPLFLDAFQPGYDSKRVAQDWLKVLLEVASEAWTLTVRSAGQETRALKAVAESEGLWLKHRKTLILRMEE